MVRLVRSFFFGRWLRVQGGDVSILPLLILLAIAIGISYFERPRPELTPLPDTVSFTACSGGPRVNCVIDGDTIWAEGEKVRLADIDAPEIFSPECTWEKHMGDRASERLTALLNEGQVALEKTGSRDRDKYGRLLRVARVNGRSVGEKLVSEGLAHRWGGPNRSWCT
ncbi:thermonuclease family protein [Henriciella aquimarina]|uniref:thermonuclease family protein n=1 Tax=Henriciella aquimarina TaxID=545261 RepID=UPI001F2E471C|nr:thermonuclease family protein [Henriciella aquimarina]